MSTGKGQKILWLAKTKVDAYKNKVKEIKRDTQFQGMNFSKMCDLGAEIVIKIYDQLLEEEVQSITDAEEFNNLIRSKLPEIFK